MAAVNPINHFLVERIYDAQISYDAGSFNYHKDEGQETYSSFPQLPTQPAPQKAYRIVSSGGNSKEIEEERVLRRIIPGVDGRRRIEDTSKYPYSIHVQIEMEFPGGNAYGGSGSMVGPHHVLTCAHNVYDIAKKCWALKIDIYPGRNKKSAPFGKLSVTRAYIFENWTNKEDKQFDIALLVLDQSIGFLTGWGGICSSNNKSFVNEKFHITGYPSDRGLDEMWSMNHVIKQIHPETFDYEIDTASGQSGSAIWSDRWGQPTIIGVHTLGANLCNSGVRITSDKFMRLFSEVISKTYSNHQEAPASISQLQEPVGQKSIPLCAFGKAKWERYFGDVGTEPPLPPDIEQILDSKCIFWPDKKVRETHLLVLIPQTVNGMPLTLNALQGLIQNPQGGGYAIVAQVVAEGKIGDQPPASSYWALVTKDVLPNSRMRIYSEQQALMQGSYMVPAALEIATSILIHHVQTAEGLYPNSPWTMTRCQELLSNGHRLAVGTFQYSDLQIDATSDSTGRLGHDNVRRDYMGIGAVRKL